MDPKDLNQLEDIKIQLEKALYQLFVYQTELDFLLGKSKYPEVRAIVEIQTYPSIIKKNQKPTKKDTGITVALIKGKKVFFGLFRIILITLIRCIG